MRTSNIFKFMFLSGDHITNINRALKSIKFEILANFICYDHCSLIITTNKVASYLNLSTIEKYIKNIDLIEIKNIMASYLPQFKSYFKIISIPYIKENVDSSINSTNIKKIIQFIHIFNNMQLVLKPYIIKVLLKPDMAVV